MMRTNASVMALLLVCTGAVASRPFESGAQASSNGASSMLLLPTEADVERYLKVNWPSQSSQLPGSDFRIFRIRPEVTGFLRKHRLFSVWSSCLCFERSVLPSGGTIGLFVTDGKDLWDLERDKQKSAEDLLRREATELDKIDQQDLARFLARSLLDNGNTFHAILSESADIDARARGPSGYVIDPSERSKYNGKIHPPDVKGDRAQGWVVEFFTLSGWMHETTVAARHRVEVSPQYVIVVSSDILSSRVFSQVPFFVY